jgi:hypothetical protein
MAALIMRIVDLLSPFGCDVPLRIASVRGSRRPASNAVPPQLRQSFSP